MQQIKRKNGQPGAVLPALQRYSGRRSPSEIPVSSLMKHPLVMITGLASLLRITSLRRLALLAVAVVVCQALATPSQAQLAPNPPGIDNSYFGKEKDGKKEKPTKAIRAAKCQQCQGARDALQEAIENWYQFQSDQAQKDINAENAKGAKADKNKLTN